MEILAQSSTAFVLTHNFQGTHILGASRGYLSDSVASCLFRGRDVAVTMNTVKILHAVRSAITATAELLVWLLGSAKPGVRHDKKGDQPHQLPKKLMVVNVVKSAHVKFRLD